MKHERELGGCERCGKSVVSAMDAKEHTIGSAVGGVALLRYRAGVKLSTAWAQLWCSL